MSATGWFAGIALAVAGIACGQVVSDGFQLSAGDAVVIVGQEAAIAVSATGDGGSPIEVVAEGLPSGVTASPAAVPRGGAAELVITAAPTAVQGAVAIKLRGTGGGEQAEIELRLLVRGPAGATDPTFGGRGLAGGEAQLGTIAAIAVDEDERILTCANTPSSLVIRRFSRDGAVDATWGTQGRYQRGAATCIDMIAIGRSLLVLAQTGSETVAFPLDDIGRAGFARTMPAPQGASAQATRLLRAPNGGVFVIGTITLPMTPHRAGLWRFDANLTLVPSFSDGTYAVPGFATHVGAPYIDAFGADAVVRGDGSLLLLVHSPAGKIMAPYEFADTGAPLPDPVYPELGLSGMQQSNARIVALPDDRMVLAGGSGDTGFGLAVGNSRFTTAQGVQLVPGAGRPAVADDLARHPAGGVIAVGSAGGRLAWRRMDANEQPDPSFAGDLPSTTPGRARVVPLPGGGFAVAGGDAAGSGHVLVRVWD